MDTYFTVPSKCALVVDDCSKDKAQDLLSSLGVHVVAIAIGSLEGLLAVRMRYSHMYLIRFIIGLTM